MDGYSVRRGVGVVVEYTGTLSVLQSRFLKL